MSKNQSYAEQYAEAAMEQMKRYGIPASVTLAQGMLESSNGESELSRLGNNHFGIKATASWLKNGGEYLVYTDDKPNEKFCKYSSVADSYEHHSKFLANNKRYAKCFQLSPDDYKGWTKGIAKAGYASGMGYAAHLQDIIERNGLQKYDQQVMSEMKAQGKSFGVENNPRQAASEEQVPDKQPNGKYSFPLLRETYLFITSPFGMRQDPMDKSKQQMHKGIDIRCKHDAVLATENGGKVVAVNQNVNTAGGKSITVEYNREDGSKVQTTYMHLSEVNVKVGDAVSAGQKIGVTGNTGTRTTGEHLHFGVKTIAADGTSRDVDPSCYLAEIAQKGNIKQQALYNGNDLLAKYKTDVPSNTESMSPDAWMKKLLSSEDSGVGLPVGSDPILEMAMTAFSSLMILAVKIDNKEAEEQKAAISQSVSERSVDLTSLVSGMKTCSLSIGDNGRAILTADNGNVKVSRELTLAELSRLSATLNDQGLSEETKRLRVAEMVNSIVISQQASQNFEQGMQEQQGRNESMHR
ncbi:glucosaminidase domain-containing protein [Prevotella merdae]|uniref:glucosaminidase domain-containing protein n=1 Tax=Prevotella merdae TaxID=2079531 RepID=UPI003567D20C